LSSNCSVAYLEKLVSAALEEVGPRGQRTAAQFGSAVDSAVTRMLRNDGASGKILGRLHVGRTFKTFGIPNLLSRTTIRDFAWLNMRWWMEDLKPLFVRVTESGQRYLRKIGNLRPDLMVELPDGSFIIWDLTSRSAEEHLMKTMLYSNVAARSKQGGSWVRIGETYYRNW
jgi:hypothetical protein